MHIYIHIYTHMPIYLCTILVRSPARTPFLPPKAPSKAKTNKQTKALSPPCHLLLATRQPCFRVKSDEQEWTRTFSTKKERKRKAKGKERKQKRNGNEVRIFNKGNFISLSSANGVMWMYRKQIDKGYRYSY